MRRSIFRLLILMAVTTLAALPSFAQQIHGQVRFADSNKPAFNVAVECRGFGCNGYQYTDRSGKFRFIFRTPGDYTITVRHEGFRTFERSFALLDRGSSEYVFITLRPDPKATGAPTAAPGVINVGGASPAARTEFESGRKAIIDDGDAERGIPHLEKAISIYPKYLEALMLLGTANMELKRWDKAERALREALKIEPKSVEARVVLGEIYRQQKKYKEAETELQEALKLNDNSWQAHLTLGKVYADMDDIVKAGPQVGKALTLKPDLAEGHLLAGNLFLKAHRPQNALVEYQEYLRLDPNGKYAEQTRLTVDKIKKAIAEEKK